MQIRICYITDVIITNHDYYHRLIIVLGVVLRWPHFFRPQLKMVIRHKFWRTHCRLWMTTPMLMTMVISQSLIATTFIRIGWMIIMNHSHSIKPLSFYLIFTGLHSKAADEIDVDAFAFGLGEDESDVMEDLVREASLDAMSSNLVPVREPINVSDCARRGNVVTVSGTRVGCLSYLLHWSPPSFSASCSCHDDCYVTAALDRVGEDSMQNWLQQGPRFLTAADHMRCRPAGTYKQRRRPT